MTTETSGPRTRLYEIDLLRISAALSVVLYHYLFSGPVSGLTDVSYPTASPWARYGYLGVDLFFVISGFVVLMSAWDSTPRRFLVSRIVRLYPAYWVAVTLTAVVVALSGSTLFQVTAVQYVANLTMFNSLVDVPNLDPVYWTLWAELRFYALVLVLTIVGLTRRRVLTALWVWLAVTAAQQLDLLPQIADLVVQSQFSHYFIAGMALFVIRRHGPSTELLLILGLCLANAIFRGIEFAADRAELSKDVHPLAVGSIIVLIFAVMLAVSLDLTRRLRHPSFVLAGSATYPLYLIHATIGFILFRLWDDVLNRWVLAILLTMLMCLTALAIHFAVERPLAPRLKRLLTKVAVR